MVSVSVMVSNSRHRRRSLRTDPLFSATHPAFSVNAAIHLDRPQFQAECLNNPFHTQDQE
jgi:hypothetical protein